MLVGQKIARATLAMMIFLGISRRREMAPQGRDATQSCPLTWQGWWFAREIPRRRAYKMLPM